MLRFCKDEWRRPIGDAGVWDHDDDDGRELADRLEPGWLYI